MKPITFRRFEAEILALYLATRRKATWFKMRQALRELGKLGIRKTSDLTPAAIAKFVTASRQVPGRSDISIHSLLTSISAACSYAVDMGYLQISPFKVMKGGWGLDREPSEEIPRHLSLTQLAALQLHLEKGSETWVGGRLHALMAVVAYTGLRKSEALHLRVEDIDLERAFLKVARRRQKHRAKTRKSAAPVPIPPPLAAILAAWMARCDSPWLFPNVTRKGPWTGGPYGKRPLDELRAAGEAAGVGRIHFRMLRHSFAAHAAAWGLGPIHLQQFLRHTTLRTQQLYIHADEAGLREAATRIRFEGPSPN